VPQRRYRRIISASIKRHNDQRRQIRMLDADMRGGDPAGFARKATRSPAAFCTHRDFGFGCGARNGASNGR
jgi:hypothetical protein